MCSWRDGSRESLSIPAYIYRIELWSISWVSLVCQFNPWCQWVRQYSMIICCTTFITKISNILRFSDSRYCCRSKPIRNFACKDKTSTGAGFMIRFFESWVRNMEDISTSLWTWPGNLFILCVGMKHGCSSFWLASYRGCFVTVFLFSLQHFRQALNDSNKCSLSKAQSKSPVIFPDDHITTSSLSLNFL